MTEGIGQPLVNGNLAGMVINDAVRVLNAWALKQVIELLQHEGLSVGGSAGLNVAMAIRVVRAMRPGHTVVIIHCDGGGRHQSKLFNPVFLRSKRLPYRPGWTQTRDSDDESNRPKCLLQNSVP